MLSSRAIASSNQRICLFVLPTGHGQQSHVPQRPVILRLVGHDLFEQALRLLVAPLVLELHRPAQAIGLGRRERGAGQHHGRDENLRAHPPTTARGPHGRRQAAVGSVWRALLPMARRIAAVQTSRASSNNA